MDKKLRAWSFSRFSDYRRCPAAYDYKVNRRLPEPPNAAMRRGLEAHAALEGFVKGELKRLPAQFQRHEPLLKRWRRADAEAELQWGFTKDWAPTGWFADDTWLRVKLDVLVPSAKPGVLDVIDYKTGGVRPEQHGEGLELYALAVMLARPDAARTVRTFAFYVDHDSEPRQLAEYDRPARDARELKAQWRRKVTPMMRDVKFKPKPSQDACRWCAFSKFRGGPCAVAAA
jgi:RecB family exonuclease